MTDFKKDVYDGEYLRQNIKAPCIIKLLDSTDSTNTEGKNVKYTGRPYVIIADEQTGGRGRMGRSFHSPKGTGLYVSVVFTPEYRTDKLMKITPMAAVAICRAARKVAGAELEIKWVNDVYYKGRKIAGILTETVSSPEPAGDPKIIIGMGINCFTEDFPEDLKDKAGSLLSTGAAKKSFSREELVCSLVNELYDILSAEDWSDAVAEYKELCGTKGQDIVVFKNISGRSPGEGEGGKAAKAVGIDDNCALVVRWEDGAEEALSSGEISVRTRDAAIQ